MTSITFKPQYVSGRGVIVLLLMVAFAFVPVRCDASAVAHSIFIDPFANDTRPASSGQPTTEMAMGHGHHHQADAFAGSDDFSGAADQQVRCPLGIDNGTDTKSQRPVGATLDLPTTPILSNFVILPPLHGDQVSRLSSPITVLSGITQPPEAPPPKPS